MRLFNVTQPIQDFTGCYMTPISNAFLLWLPGLLLEVILCALMVFKIYQIYRRGGRDPLLNILIRDTCVPYTTQCSTISLTNWCSLIYFLTWELPTWVDGTRPYVPTMLDSRNKRLCSVTEQLFVLGCARRRGALIPHKFWRQVSDFVFWGKNTLWLYTLLIRFSWIVAVPCALGSRLLLNIRERACVGEEAGETGWISTTGIQLSTIIII